MKKLINKITLPLRSWWGFRENTRMQLEVLSKEVSQLQWQVTTLMYLGLNKHKFDLSGFVRKVSDNLNKDLDESKNKVSTVKSKSAVSKKKVSAKTPTKRVALKKKGGSK